MAYTPIDKSDDYFNTVLYTGNGSTQSITGVNFQPDWVWLKQRANDVANRNHMLFDIVRGTQLALSSNTTGSDDLSAAYLTSYDSDGFTIGSSSVLNRNTTTYASWNWLAGGTASSNSNGSITSNVSANTTAGFSIVSFTGTAADATVGHGLSQAPQIYIVKNRDSATDWRVAQTITPTNTMTDGNGYYMELNDTKASTNPGSASQWGNPPTAPTSLVVSVGTSSSVNGSGNAMIIYCFHSVKGFSKMGYYTGNGNSNGTFVYTGFKPAMVIIKRTDGAEQWQISDNKRNTFNVVDKGLFPSGNFSESSSSSYYIDYISNGFKLRNTATWFNASNGTYMYMAFAENPFVTSTGIPACAR